MVAIAPDLIFANTICALNKSMMKKLLYLALSVFTFSACDEEVTEPYTIPGPSLQLVKVASIDYKINSEFGNPEEEYTVTFHYEGDRLVEVQNDQNRYDKRYRYEGDQLVSRRLYRRASAREVLVDSFFYNAYGLLEGVASFALLEAGTPDYRLKRLFSYYPNGQLAKIEDFRMPENELLFTREYQWEGANLSSMLYYYVEQNVVVDIKEVYQYDSSINYRRLFHADPDEPLTQSNITSMELTDYIGNYDGIYDIKHEISYNQDDLPVQIIRRQLGVNGGSLDTIQIHYQ